MSLSTSPNREPFQSAWQLLVSPSEHNIDLIPVQETLQELTKRYGVPPETCEKIIVSIQDALLMPGEHEVFVAVYISANAKGEDGSNHDWGFFRIERSSTSINPQEGHVRLIEFYLYLDL